MALTTWQTPAGPVTVSHKKTAITVSLTEEELVSYDFAGRMLGSYDHGTNIRRGLDNSYQHRWRTGTADGDIQEQRYLSDIEAQHHVEELRERVAVLLGDTGTADLHPETATILKRAVETNWLKLMGSAIIFRNLYGHIPILPPDQYRSLVLQATDGCTYNKCTFCTLYRDKTFRSRPATQFRSHIDDVLRFIGDGLSYRNAIFLGDANAIAINTARLVELMEIIGNNDQLAPLVKSGGISAFLDIPNGTMKTVPEYAQLRESGLRRVAVGVESGSESLLKFVDKPGTREDIISLVTTLKESHLSVVVILMIGLGGKQYQSLHREDSASLIAQLPLGKGDIIYLSEFTPNPATPYLVRAANEAIEALSQEEIAAESRTWKKELSTQLEGSDAKVAPYNFKRFMF